MVHIQGLNILYVKQKICLAVYWLTSELSTEAAREIWCELPYSCSVSYSVNSGVFIPFCVP